MEGEQLATLQALGGFRRPAIDLGVTGLDEALDARAREIRKGAREVLIQPLAPSLGRGTVLSCVGGYQIFDFTCALERRTMSLMARSKKFIRWKISWLTRLL